MREDGYTEVDLKYCKGCGICAKECPVKCIEMVRK
jgi:Pyruvate/2-oxoacid:ferredoxin oxidoreductase delta subunit